ncbi:MAG: aminopeptidase P family protein [Acidobacteriota bacterium]
MFESNVYKKRREVLKKNVGSGIILFPGNVDSPMNYPANPFHFRQDSTFLYYFGLNKSGFYGVLDVDSGEDYLFGTDFTIDDIIWMGPQPLVSTLAESIGTSGSGTVSEMKAIVDSAINEGRKVHFLPPYRGETVLDLAGLLGVSPSALKGYSSLELITAVVKQRSYKEEREIAEIEKALKISSEIYESLYKSVKPGKFEKEMTGIIEGIVGKYGAVTSFPVILSIHGETLHNHSHENKMGAGDLLIIDSGAESPEFYASDITRTLPVSGKFTDKQKDIYETVLKANETTIEFVQPGRKFKDIHLLAAEVIASGLKDLGLMKGNVEDAVKEGAHALFFPHGLGHMMGLDVHDMENLGENYVGYTEKMKRSDQFGTAYLRLARELEPGFVLTIEPGIYFIPALIDQWKAEGKHKEFINYDNVEKYRDFGGIRLEDDVLVREKGHRVLGDPIPKTVDDVEKKMA